MRVGVSLFIGSLYLSNHLSLSSTHIKVMVGSLLIFGSLKILCTSIMPAQILQVGIQHIALKQPPARDPGTKSLCRPAEWG